MKIEINAVHQMDCWKGLRQLDDNSAQVIFIDPPYNIGKAGWDNIPNYIGWLGKILVECARVLKPNGSIYICHNALPTIARIIIWIEDHIRHLSLREFIVWNKRFRVASDDGRTNPHFGYLSGYLVPDGKRNYEKMAEYMLYYTFDNGWKILRERKRRGLSQKEIAKKVLSHTGGITGWVSNVEKGLSYPNPEQMEVIEKMLGLRKSDIIPKFNNQGTHHSVWDIAIADREDHETPKPEKLIKTVLDHSSDKGDLVLVPFSGSGNVEVACKKYGRKFIGFDIDPDYVNQAREKLQQNYIGDYFK